MHEYPSADVPEKNKESAPDERQFAEIDPLRDYGQISPDDLKVIRNPRGTISYISIIGHIEGHTQMPPSHKTTKYEHIIPLLLSIAESPETEGVLIILNTVGGDVEAGLAIAELISGIPKPTASLVLGGGHSIGVPLAVSADRSFIAPTASMTIHPVRINGTIVSTPQTFEYFNKMQQRVLEFTVRHSGISMERLSKLMMETEQLTFDVGTIIVGEEAVKEGLIDEAGGLNEAMEYLYAKIAENRTNNES